MYGPFLDMYTLSCVICMYMFHWLRYLAFIFNGGGLIELDERIRFLF